MAERRRARSNDRRRFNHRCMTSVSHLFRTPAGRPALFRRSCVLAVALGLGLTGCVTPSGREARAVARLQQAADLEKRGAAPEKIETAYRQAIALNPHQAEARFRLALLLSARPGQKAEAIELLHLALRDQPDHLLALVKLGDLLATDQQGHAEALSLYRRAAELEPRQAGLWFMIGELHRQFRGGAEAAIAAYEQAIAVDPDHVAARNNLGWLRGMQPGRIKEAVAHLKRVVALSPEDPQYRASLSILLAEAGELAAAGAEADWSLRFAPESAWALAARANIRHRQDDFAGALADMQAVIAREPGRGDWYMRLGSIRMSQRDWAGALADLRKANEVEPEYRWAARRRGDCLRMLGRNDEAMAEYRRAVEFDPADAHSLTELAIFLLGQRKEREALALAERAALLAPGDDRVRFTRGRARHALHDFPGALSDYDFSVAQRPTRARLDARGHVRYNADDYAGAIADFTVAIELGSERTDSRHTRGVARFITGDFAGALADFEQGVFPDDAVMAYTRIWRFLLQRRLQLPPERAPLAGLAEATGDVWIGGLAAFLLGEKDEAGLWRLAEAGDAAVARQRKCEAHYYVGMQRLFEGDAAAARQHFTRCRAIETEFYESKFAQAELARLPP